MIDSSKMDEVLDIQQPTDTLNAFGEGETTWATFATVWAARNKDSRSRMNREIFEAEQLVAERKDFFEIRYLEGIDETFRLLDEDGEVYDIESIEELGRREALRIIAVNKDRLQEGN